jgi:serine/threonine-protein kinase
VDISDSLRSALADRYTIERELGQGGMATVYLAEDLRHHRKVALKVLRPEIAATLGAGRFAREIEVAARLQHPNILTLHDSGEAAGFFFYVMPYVEGESLRDRLARGGELPIPDAVRILMEVADALSHAHAHGVVHRDIKPDNVMLLGRHAVVTDFGVAKAVTEATGRQVLTSAGVALGTPAYMAPEQATADPHQDHRVDIYALGVLGYELLTGRAPFSATTAQEMLAAHVTAVPEPVERYRAMVSPALAAVIMKCLAKKPADRWQTADELLTQLEPLATPSGGTTPTQTAPVDAVRARRRLVAVAAGAGVFVLATASILAFVLLRAKPLNITISNITQVTSDAGLEFQPAVSPDGNEVAYAAGSIARPRLFVRSTANVAGGAAVRLGDTALGSEWLPSWSPDGQSVRFFACPGRTGFGYRGCAWRETGKLGGAARPATLPAHATNPFGLAWSPDGARVAFIVGDTIFASSTAGTGTRPVAVHPRGGRILHSLAWSPDGKWIAGVDGNVMWLNSGNVWGSSIWIVNADGGTPRDVVTDQYLNVSPAWLDARHLLFVSNRDGSRGVYLVEVGPQGRRGEPRLVPGVAEPHSIAYSIAAHKLAYARFTLRQNIWAYPQGASTTISIRNGQPVTSGSQVIETSDVSPDGKWIAFDGNLRGNMDLYRMPLGGGAAVPLTALPGDEWNPRWSPDGKELAFYAAEPGSRGANQIMVVPAVGGPPTALTSGGDFHNFPSWSPSGLDISYYSNQSGQFLSWIVSRDSVGGPWHAPAKLDFWCYELWAPDGRGVLCPQGRDLVLVSRESRVLWRRDFAATYGMRWSKPHYSRDGRTIYSVATHPDGREGVWAVPAAGGTPRLVIAFDDPALANPWGAFSVGPDRLYLTVAQYESDIWVANLRW